MLKSINASSNSVDWGCRHLRVFVNKYVNKYISKYKIKTFLSEKHSTQISSKHHNCQQAGYQHVFSLLVISRLTMCTKLRINFCSLAEIHLWGKERNKNKKGRGEGKRKNRAQDRERRRQRERQLRQGKSWRPARRPGRAPCRSRIISLALKRSWGW